MKEPFTSVDARALSSVTGGQATYEQISHQTAVVGGQSNSVDLSNIQIMNNDHKALIQSGNGFHGRWR